MASKVDIMLTNGAHHLLQEVDAHQSAIKTDLMEWCMLQIRNACKIGILFSRGCLLRKSLILVIGVYG